MKIEKDSLLYVLQWGTHGQVLRYELDGTFVGKFTTIGTTRSIGLDWDTECNLYVSSYSENIVRKYDQNGVEMGNFISNSLQGPTNIWFDDNGDLLVLNWDRSSVMRFDSTGMFIEHFIEGLSYPEGVLVLPNGNILIGNTGTNSVKLFDADGVFIEDIVESGVGDLFQITAVVAREKQMVAVVDNKKKSNFLRSTIGNGFILNDLFEDIIKIEVFNLSGVLVERKDRFAESICDKGKHVDGIYIVKATTASGAILMQKVIVKN